MFDLYSTTVLCELYTLIIVNSKLYIYIPNTLILTRCYTGVRKMFENRVLIQRTI